MVYEYKGNLYPDYLKKGNMQKFIQPIALEFCQGDGLDIGGTPEWALPGAKIVNPAYNELNALNIPEGEYDFIFSSHCLEHVHDYVGCLKYWIENIKTDGHLFLYLPHPDMEYWLPQNCNKHYHSFYPNQMKKLVFDLGLRDVLVSERDLNWSFSIVGKKWA